MTEITYQVTCLLPKQILCVSSRIFEMKTYTTRTLAVVFFMSTSLM